LLLRLEVAGVAPDREVRPATHVIDRVLLLVAALVDVRCRRHGEMAAGGEADEADALRVDAPLLCTSADQADSALGVQQWAERWFALHVPGAPRAAVLEDDARHALRIQPRGDFLAFKFPEEIVVPAARADDHRRAGVLLLRRRVDGECRLRDVR